MKRAFALYAWIAPLVLAPLSFWLWTQTWPGQPGMVAVVWGMPVLWAYLVPGVGTNVLKVWEFDARLRLGRFRLQHGFVFGSATSLIGWVVHMGPVWDVMGAAQLAFVMASVLGFWNLLYDIRALEAGVLRVYNQPWAEGREPAAIALDYAPWFFAGFGAVYGALIGFVELQPARVATWPGALLVLLASLALACAVPVAGYVHRSWRRHGHAGTRPVARIAPEEGPPA